MANIKFLGSYMHYLKIIFKYFFKMFHITSHDNLGFIFKEDIESIKPSIQIGFHFRMALSPHSKE